MLMNNEEMKSIVEAPRRCATSSSKARISQGGIILAALLLTVPGVALADNECEPVGVAPSANGAAADSYVCDDGYANGITYSSEGPLALEIDSINLGPAGMNLTGNNGDAIDLTVNFSVNGELGAEPDDWLLDLNTTGTATIDNNGFITHDDGRRDLPANDAAIRAEGAGNVVINNNDRLKGRVDFSGLDGGVVLNNSTNALDAEETNPGWNTAGNSFFGPGDDVINNLPNAWIQTSSGGYEDISDPGDPNFELPPPPVTVIDFGEGDDTFNNAGVVVAGTGNNCVQASRCPPRESRTTFQGLEVFNNTGLIMLGRGGGGNTGNNQPSDRTDYVNDDLLAMPGAAFIGSGGSRVELDVMLSGGGQSSCSGDIISDCINIEGGSTGGNTIVTVRSPFSGDRGDPADVVVIDVRGGTSAPEHFTLDPNSEQYSPAHGGVINRGLFVYPLAYDEANQQHKLAATPSDNAMQMPLIVEAAEATWRTATATWFDRQVDLRNTLHDPDKSAGIWVRANTQAGERDAKQSVSAYNRTLDYDNSHDLDTSAVNMGLDLVSAGEGNRAWILGAMIGYVHGSLDFEQSANRPTFDGFSVGLYGSYVAGDFFVDAAVNGTWSDLHMDIPDLGLTIGEDANTVSTDAQSLGSQIEAGWRWETGLLGVEPLASLSYVTTDIEEAEAPSEAGRRPATTIDFGDNTSTRGGLGVRLTLDSAFNGLNATWSLTGKVLEEFDEESEVSLQRLGPAAKLASEMDGTITEVSGGVGIHNASGSMSAFLNANLQSSDDYDSQGLSAGFRYQW